MKCVEELVKEVYDSCKIPFQLTIEEVGEFSTPLFELVQNQSEKSFNYNNTKCCIKVNTALSITLDLLKLYIEERLNKVFLSKKSIVSLLLNDKGIEEEVIKASWPILIEEFDLINIYVDNYRDEIMSYLKQGYCCKEVEIISHNGHILMFGKFEDILEHAKSIKSTIEGAVPCKAYIGYCNVERIMAKYLDKEFTDIAEKEFVDRGVNLVLGEKVSKFEGENGKVTKVVTNNGSYEGDLVVLCIGFAPNTKLVQGKLDTLPNGAIIIDEYMRTSKEDVFAAGDCCVVKYNPAHDTRYIPLATNAVRMGTLVARNIVEPTLKYMGTQGTSGIKIYEKCIASTGLTEEVAKATTKMNVASVELTDNYRPEFMPTYLPATIKLVFDKDTRRVIGGQIISDIDLTQFMNTLSVVIQNEMTIEELAMTDFFFQPHFNKPWSLLNAVALKAL